MSRMACFPEEQWRACPHRSCANWSSPIPFCRQTQQGNRPASDIFPWLRCWVKRSSGLPTKRRFPVCSIKLPRRGGDAAVLEQPLAQGQAVVGQMGDRGIDIESAVRRLAVGDDDAGEDRKSVVVGKSVSGGVDLGGRRRIKKKKR